MFHFFFFPLQYWGLNSSFATLPAFFALVILEVGLAFCQDQPGPQSLYFCFPV
jgi:hypothetical protein